MDGNQMLAGVLVSALGFGLFLCGKKQSRLPQLLGGLLLMGSPYVVPGVLPTVAVGVLIVGAVLLAIRLGV